jgi:hypothetical protein
MNNELIQPYKEENDQYPEFSSSIKEHFYSVVGTDRPLFTTDAGGLFDIFLSNLPAEARQHYTCNACRHFVNRFGDLVAIFETGEVTSVMWDENSTPEFFRKSVEAMKKVILKSKVTGVFLTETVNLGIPITGEWQHMAVRIPSGMLCDSSSKTAGQQMAEKLQDFLMLTNALKEYSPEVVNRALTLIKSESLYRSDKVLGVAEWLKGVMDLLDGAKDSKQKANIKWLAVAAAPSGFTHVRSSMIGTLLDDLAAGMDIGAVSRRFAEKMDPGSYQRAQSAPTQGNIEQAEKIVENLGITDSLRRRYAQFEEIPHLLWQSRGSKVADKNPGGVFANITPKGATEPGIMNLPSSTPMTWDKFQRTILPTAESIEVKVDNPNRFMALVTAADPSAPNILQWDNPFSWYYHGGIDGEIKRRVESAGGQYANNEIRCSLIWEGYTDLDLHVMTPAGEHIYFAHDHGKCGGWLDVDANGGSAQTLQPVENIRWSQGVAPSGRYHFYVHNYRQRGEGPVPFKVELEVSGQVHTFNGVAGNTGWKTDVFTFDYVKGQHPSILSSNSSSSNSYVSDDTWSVPMGGFVKVNGITDSPNQWDKVSHTGHHIFFLLEGCQDKSEGKGRGFFTETLKPELREIRKTLEAYTTNTAIEGASAASACGVGYSKDSEWDLVVRVTSNNATRIIKIDRWD